LRPKIGQLLLGQLVWRKIFSFRFFPLDKWTTYISQAFQGHQTHPIPTLYEPMVKFCSKQVLSSFFLDFLRSSWVHFKLIGATQDVISAYFHRIFIITVRKIWHYEKELCTNNLSFRIYLVVIAWRYLKFKLNMKRTNKDS
jgi:hypothetical protein